MAGKQTQSARLDAITATGITTGMFATNVADTDGALAANSDTRFATQKATKTYADAVKSYAESLFASNDALLYKGAIDASTNPNYPAADAGHLYRITVAGKIGGASGVNVEVGDTATCFVDSSAAGNQATVGANWNITQANLDGAVIGPAASVAGRIATFSGTTGKVIIDSGYAIGTSGANTLGLLNTANTYGALQSMRGGGGTIPAIGASGGSLFVGHSGAATYGVLMGVRSSDAAGWIQSQKVNGDTDAYSLVLNPNGGQVAVGGGATQTTSILAARVGNNGIEFGHPNAAGYGSVLGAESGSGKPFLIFNGEHGSTSSTYRTRGIKASILRSDNAGGWAWSTVGNASADNQAAADLMTLSNGGALVVSGSFASGNATMGFGANISPGAGGQAQFAGNGYTGYVAMDGTALYFGHNSGSRNLTLRLGTNNAVTVQPGGNVSINCPSGLGNLALISNNGGGNFGSSIQFTDGATSSVTLASVANGEFRISTLATERVYVKSAGGLRFLAYGAGTLVTDSSGNVSVSSDERLKIMGREFTRGLADMLKMDSPHFYRWRKKAGMDDGEYVGFGAQGARKGIPEAVGKDPRGFLTLQDRPIIATHHNAIVDLSKQLAKLRREVEKLKAA